MHPASAETGIAVLARAPVAGAAKTRLAPLLGPERAAQLQGLLTRHLLRTALAADLGPVTLWCAPDAGHPFFAACARDFGVTLAPQPEGDLGARMLAPFALARGPLLLTGTDCPAITPAHLRTCAQALAQVDAVFLPAEDGGYGLVGLSAPQPGLFADMVWSTDRVMEETRARCRVLGLTWREPATIWDVDRPEDVARLATSGLVPEAAGLLDPAARDGS